MKNSRTVLAFIFPVCLILSSCTQGPTDISSEIKEANKAFTETFSIGDANALAQYYTSNAKLYPSNSEIIEGREAIEEYWNVAINMGVKKVLLETITADSYGNFAIEEGIYKLFVEGNILIDKGKYIVSWKKENGQWKLHQDIWNTNNPPPPAGTILNGTWEIVSYEYTLPNGQPDNNVHIKNAIRVYNNSHFSVFYKYKNGKTEACVSMYSLDGTSISLKLLYHSTPGMAGKELIGKTFVEGNKMTHQMEIDGYKIIEKYKRID